MAALIDARLSGGLRWWGWWKRWIWHKSSPCHMLGHSKYLQSSRYLQPPLSSLCGMIMEAASNGSLPIVTEYREIKHIYKNFKKRRYVITGKAPEWSQTLGYQGCWQGWPQKQNCEPSAEVTKKNGRVSRKTVSRARWYMAWSIKKET